MTEFRKLSFRNLSAFCPLSTVICLAHNRNRTGDLFLTMEMLYRLSYVGEAEDRGQKTDDRRTSSLFHVSYFDLYPLPPSSVFAKRHILCRENLAHPCASDFAKTHILCRENLGHPVLRISQRGTSCAAKTLRILSFGAGGIRTLGTSYLVQQFSKLPLSTSQPPLHSSRRTTNDRWPSNRRVDSPHLSVLCLPSSGICLRRR